MQMGKKIGLTLSLIVILTFLVGCKSSVYQNATELMESGQYEDAQIEYAALGDYKDSSERATMLQIKVIMEEYREFYENMDTLTIVNYNNVMSPLLSIVEEVDKLDYEKIAEYPELEEYVSDIQTVNEGIRQLVELDRDSISQFLGDDFYMFPSTMQLSIQQSDSLVRSWLQMLLDMEFPYENILQDGN